MFSKEVYVQRRDALKKQVGSGILLFLGNDEMGLNYEDNAYRYRQDSSFLYYFGISNASLSAIIDIDEDREIIFGDELSIDMIVWTGILPTLHAQALEVGVSDTRPALEVISYLKKAKEGGREIHYLPPYRPEHRIKLLEWLGIPFSEQKGSIPFIRAIVKQRNHKSAEEIDQNPLAKNLVLETIHFYIDYLCRWLEDLKLTDKDIFLVSSIVKN